MCFWQDHPTTEVEQNMLGTIYGVPPDWSDQKREDLANGRQALALIFRRLPNVSG